MTQSVVSEYEANKRQPAVPTLARLVAATGHELTLGLNRTNLAVRGLPDTPLGRRLRQHRKALLEAVRDARGSNLRGFGSVARGQDGPNSDVDLLVDLPEQTSLFAVLALEGTLERILKVNVDLAPVTSLKPRVRAEALADGLVFDAVRVRFAHRYFDTSRRPRRAGPTTRRESTVPPSDVREGPWPATVRR